MVIGYRLLPHQFDRKTTSLEGTSLLKQLVATTEGVPLSSISVQKKATGAPVLNVAGYSCFCSISHKENIVAAAYSTTHPIGIDIENLATPKEYHRIRAHYANGFLRDCDSKQAFFYRWTLAEAYAKASGEPLLTVLDTPFTPLPDNRFYFDIHTFLLCAYVHSSTPKENHLPHIYVL